MTKKLVYFLCTGNSCRSQMAEGLARKYLPDDWEVRSAGIEAHGMNPKAVKVMAEAGIDITEQKSEIIDQAVLAKASLVVTLCGDARDHCPTIPPTVEKAHWGFTDPAKAIGTEEEVWKVFQKVRDEIKERIKTFKNTQS